MFEKISCFKIFSFKNKSITINFFKFYFKINIIICNLI